MNLKSLFLCLLFLSKSSLNAAPPVDENILHLAGTIGTATYEFSIPQVACCVNTFTVLADIRAHLPGRECAPTPLTVHSTGTTISTAGVYCLNNDPVITSSAVTAITINASNVVLDLNGHTISGNGNGILVGAFSNITIKNGNLAVTAVGVRVNASLIVSNQRNITIQDLSIMNAAPYSIHVVSGVSNTIDNLVIKNVIMNSSPTAHIFLSNTLANTANNVSGIIDSCVMSGHISSSDDGGCVVVRSNIGRLNITNCSASTTSTFGGSMYNVKTSTIVSFDNCTAYLPEDTEGNSFGFNIAFQGDNPIYNVALNNCSSFNGSSGFIISAGPTAPSILNFIFNNCQTTNTLSDGFVFSANQNPTINAIFRDCIAKKSAGSGFELAGGSSTQYNCDFQNCIAVNNDIFGFNFSTCIFNCLVNNCSARNNGASGFSFQTIGALSNCNIQNCIAACNGGFGFIGSRDNLAIFYLNQASGNNFGNYSALGTQSAPRTVFTAPTSGRADNLANVLP